jgi:hypothetical protein
MMHELSTTDAGHDVLHLQNAPVNLILSLLVPNAPYVWVRRHTPIRFGRWMEMSLPVTDRGPDIRARFRDIVLNFEISFAEFRRIAVPYMDTGNHSSFCQSTKLWPDSLVIDSLPAAHVDRILIQNGVIMSVTNSYEFTTMLCYHQGHLASALLAAGLPPVSDA